MTSSYPPRARKRRGAGHWMLITGTLLFLALAAITFRSARDAWRATIDRSRSDAIFDLVQIAAPTPRPTRTPGAQAWLDLQIKRYGETLAEPARQSYRDLVSVAGDIVPARLALARDALSAPATVVADSADLRLLSSAEAIDRRLTTADDPGDDLQFRVQRFLDYQPTDTETRTLVLTRRRSLDTRLQDDPDSPSNRFLRQATPYLAAVSQRLDAAPLRSEIDGLELNVVRIYALAEDGTFVSLRRATGKGREEWLQALVHEGQEFRKQPKMPSFVTDEFFFQFDFSAPEPAAQARSSGLYLDLAGHGLVTTVTMPVVVPPTQDGTQDGFRAVAAIDATLDIRWQDFADSVDPAQIARLVKLDAPPSPSGWQPWTQIWQALDRGQGVDDRTLYQVVSELADREQRTGYIADAGSLYHAVVEGQGAIAVFQLSREQWLTVLFPELPSHLPWLAAVLLTALGLSLLATIEVNRRRAESAFHKAEMELQEKENLLNSMRVPLTVVDPNTDAVVFGNEAAIALGLEPGRRVSELVTGDRARQHYDRMQRLSNETRRAYGVPLTLRSVDGQEEIRHAVVRSVAVAAPIETLKADQRHRLGIFFPLDPKADLAIFTEELETRTRDDERRRLAGLLAHGVDTLARVLSHRLAGGQQVADSQDDAFTRWLVSYLERRLVVTSWLLDNWHAEPPLPPETTVEAAQVEATLRRFQRIFAIVRDDHELRSRLHWDNGVLANTDPGAGSEARGDTSDIFSLHIDWPENYLFTSPVRGGIGFFLEEALANALRHGRPGSQPRVEVTLDPVRRELGFEIENAVAPATRRDLDDLEPYGGRRILERLATLFEWRDFGCEHHAERFRVSWRVPVGERADPGDVD